MIALDTNILIDLMVEDSEFHHQTLQGIQSLEQAYFCITPVNTGECLRLLTHPKVFSSHLTLSAAVELLQSLMSFYDIQTLEEPTNWWHEFLNLGSELNIRGNDIFDARIALCLKAHHVKKLYTRDLGFQKYPFLHSFYHNP